MPSPLGHALASAVLYKVGIRGKWTSDWRFLFFLIFCGNAPDLDFIPGILMGAPYRFHHGVTHSFLGATLLGLALWGVYGLFRKCWRGKDLALILGAVIIHPILDGFVKDPSPPMGVPLFYPFVQGSWMSTKAFFERTSLLEPFWSRQNLLAYGIEFIVFFPLVWVASFKQSQKKNSYESRVTENG